MKSKFLRRLLFVFIILFFIGFLVGYDYAVITSMNSPMPTISATAPVDGE